MDAFLKMDIFFVVATVAVAIVALLVAILLAYAVKLLHTINRIAENMEEEAQAIRDDIQEVRARVRRGGLRLVHLLPFFGKAAKRIAKRKKD